MPNSVQTIPLANLVLAFIPVLAVVAILYRWSLDSRKALYAVARMLVQLFFIGYVLTHIFASDRALMVVAVLAIMLFASSWIALHPLQGKRRLLYAKALGSIALGGIINLLLVTQGVLDLRPWFWPRYVIPLAGMIFASAMNTVSLAAERFEAESDNAVQYGEARRIALRASLIPLTNSLLAVGLVSLPGMMTGQILSGVSPFVAARYQIMVMCMIFGSAGMASACYLRLLKPRVPE
jgi:putative ABC transport system permease protein